jgi:hypothetical protein
MQKKRLPFKNHVLFPALSSTTYHQIRQMLLLVSIPVFCGLITILLFSVFTQLNLYFLEANGLILDEQVRGAYFTQVEIETFGVIGYVGLQIAVTALASFFVVRWASAPFTNARKMIGVALTDPQKLRPASRLLSESPAFDRMVWQFCLKIRSGGDLKLPKPRTLMTNYPFLAKFMLTFGVLSVSTSYVMSIITDSVYRKVVDLALQVVRPDKNIGHYFLAQQEMLQKANTLTLCLSLALYFLLGLYISRYMATMIFVFSRAMHEDQFPLTLRAGDIYGDLAESMNKGREKIAASTK